MAYGIHDLHLGYVTGLNTGLGKLATPCIQCLPFSCRNLKMDSHQAAVAMRQRSSEAYASPYPLEIASIADQLLQRIVKYYTDWEHGNHAPFICYNSRK